MSISSHAFVTLFNVAISSPSGQHSGRSRARDRGRVYKKHSNRGGECTMIETNIVASGNLSFTVDASGPATGAPVLLLHGFPETRRMWRHQLEALGRAGYRAIAPDQRGYSPGARPEGVEHYGTDRLVSDALSLMDAL